MRKIEDLEWVRWSTDPWGKRRKRRGKKGAGLHYENLVGEELARMGLRFQHNPWIEFCDRNGRGFASPDFVLEQDGLLLEAKLSQTDVAFAQLFNLYVPLLSVLLPDVEFRALQVCKVLRDDSAPIVESPLAAPSGAVWHWIP